MKDIVTAIQAAMADDDENGSERIIRTYRAATPKQKAVVDDILISLCGWSMKSLIERADELEEY